MIGYVMTMNTIAELELGSDAHGCVAAGTAPAIECWGTNFHRQAASDSPLQCAPYTNIPPPSGPWMIVTPDQTRMLAAGPEHTCALTAANELACWGDNSDFSIDTFDPQVQ